MKIQELFVLVKPEERVSSRLHALKEGESWASA